MAEKLNLLNQVLKIASLMDIVRGNFKNLTHSRPPIKTRKTDKSRCIYMQALINKTHIDIPKQ